MAGIPWNMAELLDRKYALMQQGADATTLSAQANAEAAKAAAALDATKAGLMPAESAAGVAATQAQTGLTAAQAGVVKPVAEAGIALNRANVGNIAEQTTGLRQLNKPRVNDYTSLAGLGVQLPTLETDESMARMYGGLR